MNEICKNKMRVCCIGFINNKGNFKENDCEFINDCKIIVGEQRFNKNVQIS